MKFEQSIIWWPGCNKSSPPSSTEHNKHQLTLNSPMLWVAATTVVPDNAGKQQACNAYMLQTKTPVAIT